MRSQAANGSYSQGQDEAMIAPTVEYGGATSDRMPSGRGKASDDPAQPSNVPGGSAPHGGQLNQDLRDGCKPVLPQSRCQSQSLQPEKQSLTKQPEQGVAEGDGVTSRLSPTATYGGSINDREPSGKGKATDD